MIEIITKDCEACIAEDLTRPCSPKKNLIVWWLGQAGFALRFGNINILIDPYLSDSLAKKYKSSEFPHIRMIPPPMDPREARHIDFIVCTHRHTDHMDAETIIPILQNNPQCKLLFPKAWKQYIIDFGGKEESLIPIENNEVLQITPDIRLTAIPSAHESLDRDGYGNYLYLGYVFEFNKMKLYHSGDCVPYEGLVDSLKGQNINAAFLPVNGRDEFRKARGVPGNFTYKEALEICSIAQIKYLIPHHFGLFDFNTIPVKELNNNAKSSKNKEVVSIIPEIKKKYLIYKTDT
mgnify:CR=1 FL=1|tara:strand:+ start:8541 stop:9416 length:876 start_codon:yes stop_codon:yes gene_type:complete